MNFNAYRKVLCFHLLWAVVVFNSHSVMASCDASIPATSPDSHFLDLNDGTVVDKSTGLMWKVCTEGLTWNNGTCSGTADTFNWQLALNRPTSLNTSGGFAGHTDWRLPNIKELSSLVERQCSPTINSSAFGNIPNSSSSLSVSLYWSSTPSVLTDTEAWVINFKTSGTVFQTGRTDDIFLRLVRDSQ